VIRRSHPRSRSWLVGRVAVYIERHIAVAAITTPLN